MKDNKVFNWVKEHKTTVISAAGLALVAGGAGLLLGKKIEHNRLESIITRIIEENWTDYHDRFTLPSKLDNQVLGAEICDLLTDLNETCESLKQSGEKDYMLKNAENLMEELQLYYDVNFKRVW